MVTSGPDRRQAHQEGLGAQVEFSMTDCVVAGTATDNYPATNTHLCAHWRHCQGGIAVCSRPLPLVQTDREALLHESWYTDQPAWLITASHVTLHVHAL
jgi:hypothetical protein